MARPANVDHVAQLHDGATEFGAQPLQWLKDRQEGGLGNGHLVYSPSSEEDQVHLADRDVGTISSRMDSTTEEFTALATPIEPPLVIKAFLAGDDATIARRPPLLTIASFVVGGGGEHAKVLRSCRRTVLEVTLNR